MRCRADANEHLDYRAEQNGGTERRGGSEERALFASIGRSSAFAFAVAFTRRRTIPLLVVVLTALLGLPALAGTAAAAGTQGSVRMDGSSSMITVPDNAALRLTSNFTLEV